MLSARRLQRRLNGALLLESLPPAAWAAASAFAATRILWPAGVVWVSTAALGGAALWCAARLQQRAWSEAQAAVVLDRLAGAGGLLLTLREVPDAAWQPQLADRLACARAPAIAWKKPSFAIVGAVAFALAALFVPRPAPPVAHAQVAAQHALEQLAARETALAQEMPVPQPLAAELARLREEAAQGTFDATDWEAADNAGEALDEAAKARAQALERAARQAERFAQTLAQKSDSEAQAREREALEQALSELGGAQDGASQQAQEQQQGGTEKPGGEGQQQSGSQGKQGGSQQQAGSQQQGGQGQKQGGTPQTRADAQALRDALEQRKQQLSKAFPNASPQGTPSAGQSEGQSQHGQSQQGQGQGHHQAQGKNPGQGEATEIGQGGPGHGAAPDSPLRFGDETKFQENRLQFAPLPQGQGGDDSGTPWGLSRRAPKLNTDPALGAPVGAAPGGDDAPGGRTGIVPPRHRELVRRYFDQNARIPARSP